MNRNTAWWASVPAVFEFELRRAMTPARGAWWCVMALFPVGVITLPLLSRVSRNNVPPEVLQFFLFALIPMMVSMLGTFLWTASAVSSELEKQSWIYLAVRPGGRVAVVLGKFAVAVAWVLPATLVAATLSTLVVAVSGCAPGVILKTWFALVRVCCLAVPAYAAIYLMLGTLFTKRSMVICVAYTLIFELVVSFVPALINKFTIQYRLRALYIEWAGIDMTQAGNDFPMDIFGEAPAWQHVSVLVVYAMVLVAVATLLVRSREYLITVSADVS